MDKGASHSPIENTATAAEKRAKVRLSLKGHEVIIKFCVCVFTEVQFGTVKSLHQPKKA